MPYSRILLDADDTIFDFQAGNRVAVEILMRELGLYREGIFDVYQKINHACWQALDRGEMTQEILHVERFRRFLSQEGRDDDPRKVADRFAELLGSQCIPLPGAEEAVRALSKIAPVVLLTNGITVIQKARIALCGFRDCFSRIVISQEEGYSKPDPRLFEIALCGTPAEKALMIGDGTGSDMLGANRAGIDFCWFDPAGKPVPEGMHAEYVTRDPLAWVTIAQNGPTPQNIK